MKILLLVLGSYLIGSFSSSYILGKMIRDLDIREHGSGNAGATNALRVMGIKIAAITFIMDAFKGFLAIQLGKYLIGFDGALIASVFVVIGHNYPIFLNFKGGKGIATSLGIILTLNWKVALMCLVVWILITLITKYVSLASIMGVVTAPIALNLLYKPIDLKLNLTIMFLVLSAVYRHKENISRLLNGTESKIF